MFIVFKNSSNQIYCQEIVSWVAEKDHVCKGFIPITPGCHVYDEIGEQHFVDVVKILQDNSVVLENMDYVSFPKINCEILEMQPDIRKYLD